LSSGAIFSIANPVFGNWSVTVNGAGDFSVTASGESTLDLTSFRFVEPGGRPDHEGFFPIAGLPEAGGVSTVDAVMSGDFNTAQFELRTKAGTVLQTLSLTRGSGVAAQEFVGAVTLPNTSFLAYVTGLDVNGAPYQRALPSTVKPQTVKIIAPPSQVLRPGQTTTYTFQVKNVGPADTFTFSGADDKSFLRSVSPTTFTLNANETRNVTVQLQPPINALPGASDTLTVTVRSATTDANNFAVVTSTVTTPNNPPDCSLAQPSVTTLWPPNHKMVEVSIFGVTDPDGDPVIIKIDRILQDEPTDGLGDGDTCPDAQGVGTSTVQLRAERSGAGNGRVYTIFFTATDGNGGSCQGSVKVSVPHNRGDNAVDNGPTFDSTVCRL
jgi:archaellum component FlaG (FlaF/FlaG flagellin family)